MSQMRESPIATSLIFLMLFASLSPLLAQPASAGGSQGIITTFSDGSTFKMLDLAGGAINSSAAVTLERNTTITNAAFDIEYSTANPTPGEVILDIGGDGLHEWAWNSQGYGDLGEQTVFSNGATSASGAVNSSGVIVGEILLPGAAQIQFSDATVEFTPDFGGGWVATGAIDSLRTADIDGDNLPEPLFLQRGHVWANGSVSPAVGVLDWSAATGFAALAWTPICDGAASIEAADFNGDGYADVAGFDSDNASACLLISGTNGVWASNTNLSLGVGVSDITVGDMDGDGDFELISVHGSGDLKEFAYNPTNGSMGLGAFTTVNANGTGMTAILGDVAVGKFWGAGNDTVVVADSMDGHVTMWNITQGGWVIGSPNSSFDCMKNGMTPVDWNQDGFLDLLGSTDTGMCTSTFNGTSWSTNLTNSTQLNNYSIGDWNQNGTIDILQPTIGTTDGNDATFTGYLSSRPFGVNGSVHSPTRTLYPHTAPRDVEFADMDGDGVVEHLVYAGESTLGLFIAGWHNTSIDFDSDMNWEAELIGYAGDGVNGVDPLEWMDMGNISQSLGNTFSSIAGMPDYFGTPITTLRVVGMSTGLGDVTLSGLNITYDASFTIDENPSAGNLSNLFNSVMLPGSGTFNVSLPVNTTLPTGMTMSNVLIEWVAGMANPVYKDAPVFQDDRVHWDSAENRHVVMLWWDDTAMQDLDWMHYQLFRWENGQTPQLNSPIQGMVQDNFTFDAQNVSGKTWDYVVRGVYQNGVYSNFSAVLTITVPEIQPPDVTPPEAVAEVIAVDAPSDEGGFINVSWVASNSTDVHWYALYVDSSPITDVTSLTEVANYTVYDNRTNYTYLTAEDGVNHYFAVICGDLAGNVNWTATNSDPAMSRNNSLRATSATLSIQSGYDDGTSSVVATASHPFNISGILTSEGEPVAGDYTITITGDGATPIVITGTTDPTGSFEHQWADWLDFETEHSPLAGSIDVQLDYAGGIWGNDSQALSSATDSLTFSAQASATLSLNPPSLQLDESGGGIITISLTADNPIEQPLLNGLAVDYQIGNETNLATSDSGSLSLDAAGEVDLAIVYIIGGEIDVSLSVQPPWLSLSNSQVRAILLPPPVIDDGEENQTEEPTPELTPMNLTCDDEVWNVEENGTALTRTCTVDNPNSVMVHIEISAAGPAWLDLDVIPTSASIFSNSSKDIQISLAAPLNTPADNYSFDISIVATAATYNDTSTDETIDFTVVAEENTIIIDDGNNGSSTTDTNEPEGSSLWIFAAAGILILVAALAVFMVLIRRITSDDSDDEEDDDYDLYDDFYDDDEDEAEEQQPKRKGRPKVLHTPAKIREKKHEWAVDESGLPYKGAKPGARPSQRVKPKSVSKIRKTEPQPVVEEYPEEEYEDYEEEEDFTQSDNYHVDDDGVEWWKDELDVWWYRYPDEEEWSEFIE